MNAEEILKEPSAHYGSEGYKKLIVWQNAYQLRREIFQVTIRFPSIEMRRVSQMRDAARSVKQNIQEGYYRNSLGEYIRSLEISRGSLVELTGDLEDCRDDQLISETKAKELLDLSIRTRYLLDRLLTSLYRYKKSGVWVKKWSSE